MDFLADLKFQGFKLCLVFLVALQVGCLREPEQPPNGTRSGYAGCLSAESSGKNEIKVMVELPTEAQRVDVYRDGVKVGSVFPGNTDENAFIDSTIPVQGNTYRYTCAAIIDGVEKVGYNEPSVYTEPEDAPNFLGIDSVTINGNVKATLTWKPAELKSNVASKVAKYKIWANLNRAIGSVSPSIDYSAQPIAVVTSSTAKTYTIDSGLGDNLPYVFAVTACTHNDLCSGSTVYKTASTGENGAPKNATGITEMGTLAGGVSIKAPWNESMGEIAKRRVYMGTTASTSISDYTQIKTIPISLNDLKDSSQLVSFTDFDVIDSRIAENTQYYFALVDEDASGNKSSVIPFALHTYDLTPPSFMGIITITLTAGSESSSFDIKFTTTNSEGSPDFDAQGASSYVIDYTSTPYVDGSESLADPCSNGTRLATTIAANPGGVGGSNQATQSVGGFTPRTSYKICMRAKDKSGNETQNVTAYAMKVTTLDTKAPDFDGIQGLGGQVVGGEYHLKLDWNAATDQHSSVKFYRVKLWSDNPADDTTTIDLSASVLANNTGTLISKSQFNFGLGYKVYAKVDACDSAGDVPGGSDICTSYPDNLAMTINPPDVEAPTGFLGIETNNAKTFSTTHATATIGWKEPMNGAGTWTPDFFGFRIYNTVENPPSSGNYDLELLNTCVCAVPGACVSPGDLSCDVTGLSPNREYRFYVRAVDAAGNETLTPSYIGSYKKVTIVDTHPPIFSPANVAVSWDTDVGANKLTWSAATDDQFTGNLTYEIYRKIPGQGNFSAAEIADPVGQGLSPRATASNVITFTDVDSNYSSIGGGQYYYFICVKDASNNRTCDTTSVGILLPDVRRPDLGTLVTDKTSDTNNKYKRWYLQFTATDNSTSLNNLNIQVYTTYTASPDSVTAIPGNLNSEANNFGNRDYNTGTNTVTINNLSGIAQFSGYANYLISVKDDYGNESTLSASLPFDNTLTVASVAANQANKDIAKNIVIQGAGFSKGTENNTGTDVAVSIGGVPCTNLQNFAGSVITCDTGTAVDGAVAGPVDVVVTNPDGTVTTLVSGFTYTDGIGYPHDTCDTPAAQAGSPFASGVGTEANPFVICTTTQFSNINSATYADKFFKVGAHLDLTSLGAGNFGTTFTGGIDGSGFMLYNKTGYSPFQFFGAGFKYFKNFVLFNNTLTGCNSTSKGGFIGSSVSSGTFSNISIINSTISSSNCTAVFGKIIHGTDPIVFDGITVSDLTVTAAYKQGFYASTTGFTPGKVGVDFKNINIDWPVDGTAFNSIAKASFENITVYVHHATGTNPARCFYGSSQSFKDDPEYGYSKFKNINCTVDQPMAALGQPIYFLPLTENAVAENINITIKNIKTASILAMPFLMNGIYLANGSTVRNINFTLENPPSDTTNYGFSSVIEGVYFEDCGGTSPTIEKISYSLPGTQLIHSFIKNIIPTSRSGCSFPIAQYTPLKIIKSTWETQVPTGGVYGGSIGQISLGNMTPQASVTDPTKPVLEFENVKIIADNSSPLLGVIRDGTSVPYLVNGISVVGAASFTPYVKYTNTLLVPAVDLSSPYVISQTDSDIIYDSICNLANTGSSGNFHSNSFTQYTAGGGETTCDTWSSKNIVELQDSGSGNIYEAAGWDFTNIWKWPAGTGYPELR